MTLPLAIATAFTFSTPAQASLTSYTANGVDLVRMQGAGFDVSFTKDGNLFQTLANGYAGGAAAFINAVIASVPGGKIYDTPNAYDTPANSGYHILSSSDFNAYNSGTVSWFGGQAFIGYLNSVSYGGSSQWQLPTVTDTGTPGCDIAFSGTDCAWNVDTSTSALAQLYFGELSKITAYNASGTSQSGYGIFGDNNETSSGSVGPFSNVQSNSYWSGTEYAPISKSAWHFGTWVGYQLPEQKDLHMFVWAITPGQVAAVPLPSAVWMMGTGLLGLLGLNRRNKIQ